MATKFEIIFVVSNILQFLEITHSLFGKILGNENTTKYTQGQFLEHNLCQS